MEVQIDEIVSSVRATDSQELISPRRLAEIVRAVKDSLADQDRRDRQASAERRVTASTSTHLTED